MPGPESLAGVVRHLVMAVPRRREGFVHQGVFPFARPLVHRPEGAACRPAAEGGRRFDRQMVCRNMTGSKPDGLFEALPETRLPEPGDAENQVEGHVPESRLLRTPKGLFGLGRRMTPVHQAKGPVVERLHPDAQAVDLRAGEGLEVGSVEVVGIGLHGALLDRGTVEQRGGMIHELLQPCGGQQRRRAASEIDCPHMPIRKEGCGGLQLAVHRFDERVASPQLDAVEKVAVGAELSLIHI